MIAWFPTVSRGRTEGHLATTYEVLVVVLYVTGHANRNLTGDFNYLGSKYMGIQVTSKQCSSTPSAAAK